MTVGGLLWELPLGRLSVNSRFGTVSSSLAHIHMLLSHRCLNVTGCSIQGDPFLLACYKTTDRDLKLSSWARESLYSTMCRCVAILVMTPVCALTLGLDGFSVFGDVCVPSGSSIHCVMEPGLKHPGQTLRVHHSSQILRGEILDCLSTVVLKLPLPGQ